MKPGRRPYCPRILLWRESGGTRTAIEKFYVKADGSPARQEAFFYRCCRLSEKSRGVAIRRVLAVSRFGSGASIVMENLAERYGENQRPPVFDLSSKTTIASKVAALNAGVSCPAREDLSLGPPEFAAPRVIRRLNRVYSNGVPWFAPDLARFAAPVARLAQSAPDILRAVAPLGECVSHQDVTTTNVWVGAPSDVTVFLDFEMARLAPLGADLAGPINDAYRSCAGNAVAEPFGPLVDRLISEYADHLERDRTVDRDLLALTAKTSALVRLAIKRGFRHKPRDPDRAAAQIETLLADIRRLAPKSVALF